MLLILFLSFASSLQIHLLSSGAISEDVVKSNLVNAYRRYLKTSREPLSLRLNGELKIGPIAANSEQSIVASINSLQLGDSGGSCIDWFINKLVKGSKVYIVADMNPCNGTQVIEDAHKFVNGIISIGMGPAIDSYWLRNTCGPCGRFGCMSGWDWFKI